MSENVLSIVLSIWRITLIWWCPTITLNVSYQAKHQLSNSIFTLLHLHPWILFCTNRKNFLDTTLWYFGIKKWHYAHLRWGQEAAGIRTGNNLTGGSRKIGANCSSMKGHLKLTECVPQKKGWNHNQALLTTKSPQTQLKDKEAFKLKIHIYIFKYQ